MEIHNIYIPPEILIKIFKNLNPSQQILLSNINHDLRNFIKQYITQSNKMKFILIMYSDNISLLKWCIYNGCDINRICHNLSYKGHLECLKYACENGYEWNKCTCSNAAYNGHLECLKYSHINGCPLNEYTCSNAAYNGHLECLKYAR